MKKKGMEKIFHCISGPGHPRESWTITLDMGYPNCALRSCLKSQHHLHVLEGKW